MIRPSIALIAAVLCFVGTFVGVPIANAMGLPNPGYAIPTITGIVLLLVWSRISCRWRP